MLLLSPEGNVIGILYLRESSGTQCIVLLNKTEEGKTLTTSLFSLALRLPSLTFLGLVFLYYCPTPGDRTLLFISWFWLEAVFIVEGWDIGNAVQETHLPSSFSCSSQSNPCLVERNAFLASFSYFPCSVVIYLFIYITRKIKEWFDVKLEKEFSQK